MRAAFKWRIQNGIYGYLTDENNQYGPFIYTVQNKKRVYYGLNMPPVYEETNDNKISSLVSKLSQTQYVELFTRFKAMMNSEYPEVSLLDVTYYYNMENDECVESASSLKCAVTDIIFRVSGVTPGYDENDADVEITAVNTSTANGNIEYDMFFTLPKGAKGDKGDDGETPDVSATAVATTLEPEQSATVSVTTGGTIAEPVFNFEFGIPKGKGVNSEGGIDVKTVNISGTTGGNNSVSLTETGLTIENTTEGDTTIIASTGITIENEDDDTTIINSTSVSTTEINSQYTKDTPLSGIINEVGWYTIYDCKNPSYGTPSTVRFSLCRGYNKYDSTNPDGSEEYYIEANLGFYSDSYCSLTLLNGNIPTKQCITQVRVTTGDTANEYLVQMYNGVVAYNEKNRVYYLSNIEGEGEPVCFIKETNTRYTIQTLLLDNGLVNNSYVSTPAIKNKRFILTGITDVGSWYTIYKCKDTYYDSTKETRFYDDKTGYAGAESSAKLTIARTWGEFAPEVYTLLINYGYVSSDGTSQLKSIQITQLSGYYADESRQSIDQVRVVPFFEGTVLMGWELQVHLKRKDDNIPVYHLTLVEGIGEPVQPYKSATVSEDKTRVLTLNNGFVNDSKITTSSAITDCIDTNTISTTSINTQAITATGNVDLSQSVVTLPQSTVQGILPIGSITMYVGNTAPSGWIMCNDNFKSCFTFETDTSNRAGRVTSSTTYNQRSAFYLTRYNFTSSNYYYCYYTGSEDYWELIKLIAITTQDSGKVIKIQGSTFFAEMNFQNRFPLGGSSTSSVGAIGGESAHTLTIQEMPSHSHELFQGRTNTWEGITGDDSITGTGQVGGSKYGYGAGDTGHGPYIKATGDSKPHGNMPPYLEINFIIKYK